jgi:hypothetical protein
VNVVCVVLNGPCLSDTVAGASVELCRPAEPGPLMQAMHRERSSVQEFDLPIHLGFT